MKSIGILMREHRLIEKMIDLLKEELTKIGNDGYTDIGFIDFDIDFFRMYVDRAHHGKEEDILFKQLASKPLSSAHREMMEVLLREHERARGIVNSMSQAKKIYSEDKREKAEALTDIKAYINELIVLYPSHIEKEDKQFFFPSLDYFTEEEQMTMVQQFYEFDMQMMHEKYREQIQLVKEELEAQR